MSTTTEEAQKPTTLAAWKKNAVHPITLPSGSVVSIKVPDITGLIESGAIPNDLLEAAVGQVKNEGTALSKEDVDKENEFRNLLVSLTVAEPHITPEDAAGIPAEDKDLIVAIATRRTDLDAEGKHIAGLDKSEKFRRFRRIGEFDPLLEGVSGSW